MHSGGFGLKKKGKKYVIGLVIGLILIAGIVTTVVLINSRKEKALAGGEDTQKQSTISLQKMDLIKSISATGTVQSKKTKLVSAQVNGIKVKEVKASVGDEVKKGDVLVSFDESDLQEALSEAEETLSDAKKEGDKNLSSAKKQLSEAKETYREEKEKLASEVSGAKKERSEARKQVSRLKKQISAEKNAEAKAKLQEQLTKAEESLKQAETGYETALTNQEKTNQQNKGNIENAENAVETAESNRKKSIKEAEKQVSQTEESLKNCQVTAPCDGVITASTAEEGDVYSGGDLFQIDDTGFYTVSTTVDEYDIGNVAVGQKVVILTEATGEDEMEGEITFVAPSTGSTTLSSGSSQSGESGGMSGSGTSSSDGYEVKIKIKTTDERLRMGLTARCSIILEQVKDVYAVPYDAVHENKNGTTAIHVAEGDGDSRSSREILVTKGMESDYYIEIQGDELEEGLSVIIPTDEVSDQKEETQKDEAQEENSFGMFGGGAPGGGENPMKGNRGSDGGRGPGM